MYMYRTCHLLFAVGDQFSQEAAISGQGYSANVPIFGDLYSWGWNIKEKLIYHAGSAIARYPVTSGNNKFNTICIN